MKPIIERIAQEFGATLYTEEDGLRAAQEMAAEEFLIGYSSGNCFHKHADNRTWCCPTTYLKLCPEQDGAPDLVMMPCTETSGIWHAYLLGITTQADAAPYFEGLGKAVLHPEFCFVAFSEENAEEVIRQIMYQLAN